MGYIAVVADPLQRISGRLLRMSASRPSWILSISKVAFVASFSSSSYDIHLGGESTIVSSGNLFWTSSVERART